MKLVLDENLSPKIAEQLRAKGVDIIHLRERGMLGASDADVLELAFSEERVLVTLNVADFEKLVSKREVHAGVVLVTPGGLQRSEQLEVILSVLTSLDGVDMVNQVLRADVSGAHTLEELP